MKIYYGGASAAYGEPGNKCFTLIFTGQRFLYLPPARLWSPDIHILHTDTGEHLLNVLRSLRQPSACVLLVLHLDIDTQRTVLDL